jgi:anti-anti-sigma factor
MAAEAKERPERFVPGTVAVTFAAPSSVLIALRGEWDVSTQPQLAEALQHARGRQNVVIDLSDCSFVDSTTIGMLITLDHQLAADSGRLEIALPPSHNVVNRAFSLLGVREVLSVHDAIDVAQRSLPTVRAASSTDWLNPSRPMAVD